MPLKLPTQRDQSIEEAAHLMGVSSMTVRNGIKTGYLTQTSKDTVSGASITRFWQNVAGQEKLISRANTLQKDVHDHSPLQAHFQNQIQTLKNSGARSTAQS